jgi:phosphohistidine phosphatase
MKLYLLRHGHSPSLAESQVSHDGDRPLSQQGRQDVRASVEYLLQQGARVERILSSPLKRAMQTAQEARRIIGPNLEIQAFDPLSNQIPGTELFRKILQETTQVQELLLVGHQPQLGEMAFRATGNLLELQPAGLIALEAHQEHASFLWCKNP